MPSTAPPTKDAPTGQDAAIATLRRRAGQFGLLLLAAVLVLSLPLPWQAGALVLTTAAVVLGVRALVGSRGTGAGLLVPLLGAGVGLAAVLSLSVASTLVVYDLSVQQQECLSRAITTSATHACETQYREGLQSRIDGFLRRD